MVLVRYLAFEYLDPQLKALADATQPRHGQGLLLTGAPASIPQRVQVPNVGGFWSQIPYPETSNVGDYLRA